MMVKVVRITWYGPSHLGFEETEERGIDRYTQSPMCTSVGELAER
jgi:hypothetical protein